MEEPKPWSCSPSDWATRLALNMLTHTALPSQIVENTGIVMAPYMDFPQLLAVLLRMLHEGGPQQRREVMKVGHCSWRLRHKLTAAPACSPRRSGWA